MSYQMCPHCGDAHSDQYQCGGLTAQAPMITDLRRQLAERDSKIADIEAYNFVLKYQIEGYITTIAVLEKAVEEAEKRFNALVAKLDEIYKSIRELNHNEALELKNRGDMQGYNFFEGMSHGAINCDIDLRLWIAEAKRVGEGK